MVNTGQLSTKRIVWLPSRRQHLIDISLRNVDIADELIAMIKELDKSNQVIEAERLISVAEDILSNNRELQRVLSRIN